MPQTEQELMTKADDIAGLSVSELAMALSVELAPDLKKNKGWLGQLIELALGASSGSKAQQDFPHLNIELKTIPISYQLTALETTYITTAPLLNNHKVTFEETVLYQKLQRILWIPIQGERDIPLGERRIGMPLLWQPSDEEWRLLKQDWEEAMEYICLGHVGLLTARQGQVLQVRPKAANGRCLTDAIGFEQSRIQTRPRGFYLKKEFTNQILRQHYL